MSVTSGPVHAEQKLGDGGADAASCWLSINGGSIESLTLENANGNLVPLTRPGPRVSLPAGKYLVRDVHLAGGFQYRYYDWMRDEWFEVSPGTAHELSVGAPLSPAADVTRRGRLLYLHYKLVDSAGREYSKQDRTGPPTFAVHQDGREIGSGSFEYG